MGYHGNDFIAVQVDCAKELLTGRSGTVAVSIKDLKINQEESTYSGDKKVELSLCGSSTGAKDVPGPLSLSARCKIDKRGMVTLKLRIDQCRRGEKGVEELVCNSVNDPVVTIERTRG